MRHAQIALGMRLEDAGAAVALLQPCFAGLAHEELRVVHLDAEFRSLRMTVARGASPCSVDVPLRRIVADALALDARGLILAHNHPGGDPTPSAADKAVTRRVAEVAGPLGLRLVDHLVFGGEGMTSFRGLGLL